MHLFWIQGPRRQARLRLEGSFFVIGRAEAFPVFQDDVTISREHAVVVSTPQGVSLKDLGSRNGVVLNGRKLARYEEVLLSPGDELLVGKTTVRWLREGEQEPAPPPGTTTQQLRVDRDGRSDPGLVPGPVGPTEVGTVDGAMEGEGSDSGEDLTRTEEDLIEEEPAPDPADDAEATVDLAPGEAPAFSGEETEAMDAPPPPPAPEPEPEPEEPPPPLLE